MTIKSREAEKLKILIDLQHHYIALLDRIKEVAIETLKFLEHKRSCILQLKDVEKAAEEE